MDKPFKRIIVKQILDTGKFGKAGNRTRDLCVSHTNSTEFDQLKPHKATFEFF